MKKRSLRSQLIYAIKTHYRFGQSKRLDRAKGIDTSRYIYSYGSKKRLQELINPFTQFLETYYPDIKNLKELNDQIMQEFIEDYLGHICLQNLPSYKYRLSLICKILNDSCKTKLSYHTYCFKTNVIHNRKSPLLTRADFTQVNAYFLNLKAEYRILPFITYTIGTRFEEACFIKVEDIDLKKRCVFLRNTKNAKHRTVSFDKDFLPGWTEIKNNCLKHQREYIIQRKTQTIKRSILKRFKESSQIGGYDRISNHDIRKLYARRRLVEELEKEFNIDKAWRTVQIELGHGEKHRSKLMKIYIGITKTTFKKNYDQSNFYALFK